MNSDKDFLEEMLDKAGKSSGPVVRKLPKGFSRKEWDRRKKRRKIAKKARRFNRSKQ